MSGLGNHGHPVRDRDRWIPGSPPRPLSPRCGKPMLRYEAANGPMLETPECGRPRGHNGRCRTVQAIARARRKDAPLLVLRKREARLRAAQARRRAVLAAALREFDGYRRRPARASECPAPRRSAA